MELIGDCEYSKKDLIGHGAFAVVFKGHLKKDPSSPVAIKCITKKNLAKSAALLSKEIKILRELSGLNHENVVALMDCKETSHHVFLIMEYCNGGDLADYLQAKGTLSEDTIALFLRDIAAALKAFASKNVVHRDLKPQNILLCHSTNTSNPHPRDITLKIADFGFARFLNDGVMAATLCGSPMYMAPEVIMSLQYDAKADLWSIGTIVYQCLTGKAPFQAQTPQQLKQFYERNANLAPNVPHGTSPELRDLLIRVLKRNAKERIEFEKFFKHPFFSPDSGSAAGVVSSAPVPVPRTRSKSSISSDSPRMQAISASPLSGHVGPSPPRDAVLASPRTRRPSVPEPMDTTGSTQSGDGSMQAQEQEGFVLVPEHVPADQSGGASPKVDLNAIFSDASDVPPPRPPRLGATPSTRHTPPSPGGSGGRQPSPMGSPSRPSSFPVEIAVSSRPSSEPIPVPTQRKNYEIIQRSIRQSPNSPGLPTISPRKSSGGSSYSGASTAGLSPLGAVAGSAPPGGRVSPAALGRVSPLTAPGPSPQAGNRSRSNSSASLASSPPQVQFCVGTPPTQPVIPRRSSVGCPVSSSPGKRTAGQMPPRAATYTNLQGTGSALTTIQGSPTKLGDGRMPFPPTEEETEIIGHQHNSAFGPLRRARTRTCPDFVHNNNNVPHASHQSMVPVNSVDTDPAIPGSSRLPGSLLRAAFGAHTLPQPPTTGLAAQLTAHSPPGALPSLLMNIHGGSSGSLNRIGSNTSLTRVRRYSSNEPPTDQPSSIPESSPEPVSFVAPDLEEDTLMDSVHKETVNKVNFVLALVECIIEIANMKSSMLSDSMVITPSDRANDNPDNNRVDELLLMVRALQLLGATIQLAKEEVQAKRLQPNGTVKTILVEMTGHYHKCLLRCKELHKLGITDNANMSASVLANTADRIIYTYAIEMCQTAALDELFGDPKECFHHYRNAHILLHSLSEKADDQKDKELLSRYRESVEKRILSLYNQGQIDSFTRTDENTNHNTDTDR